MRIVMEESKPRKRKCSPVFTVPKKKRSDLADFILFSKSLI